MAADPQNKNVASSQVDSAKLVEKLALALCVKEGRRDPVSLEKIERHVRYDLNKPENWEAFTDKCFPLKSFKGLLFDESHKSGLSHELRTLRTASENINTLNSQDPVNSVALLYERLKIQFVQSAIVHQYLFDSTTSDASKFRLLNTLFEEKKIPEIVFHRILDEITAGVVLKKIAESRYQEFRIGSAVEREFKFGDFYIGDQPILLGYYNRSAMHLFENPKSLGYYLLSQLVTENHSLLPDIAKDINRLLKFLEENGPAVISSTFSGFGMGKLTRKIEILSKIYLNYKVSIEQNLGRKAPFFMITNGELIKRANGDTWNNQFTDIAKEFAPRLYKAGE